MRYLTMMLLGILLLMANEVKAQGTLCAPCESGTLMTGSVSGMVDTVSVNIQFKYNASCNPRYLEITGIGTGSWMRPITSLMGGIIQKLLTENPMGFTMPSGSNCMRVRVVMISCWDYDNEWSTCTNSIPCCAVYENCGNAFWTRASENSPIDNCIDPCKYVCSFPSQIP